MIIYEGTNNLVSGAFLKCFSIFMKNAEFSVLIVSVSEEGVCSCSDGFPLPLGVFGRLRHLFAIHTGTSG